MSAARESPPSIKEKSRPVHTHTEEEKERIKVICVYKPKETESRTLKYEVIG